MMKRLVDNLLDNAKKYAGGGAKIIVSSEGNYALLTISDSGPGVNKEDSDIIFEPFYRGKAYSGPAVGSTLSTTGGKM